jgi:hypothetical protein
MALGIARLNTLSKILTRFAKSITANGNAQVSTTQDKFGGASALFDGTGDYLNVTPTSDFAFGTSDFTIEFWAYLTSTVANEIQILYDGRDTSQFTQLTPVIYVDTPGTGNLIKFYAGSTDRITGSGLSSNTWTHIAVSRASGSTKLFINGTQSGSTYSDSNNYVISSSSLWIGNHRAVGSGSFGFRGHIDEIRVSNVARYTSNFAAPSASFTNDANTLLLIHADGTNGSQVFTDDVTNRDAKTISLTGDTFISTADSVFGGASVAFDGNDTLNVTDQVFTFGTGDFTIEGWFKRSNDAAQGNLFNFRDGTTSQARPFFYTAISYRIAYFVNGANRILSAVNSTVGGNWYHIAVSRQGTSTRMFLDGVLQGTWTDTTDYLPAALSMGSGLNGFMDEIRISNSARYIANFTTPTAPFTNDANTLLLIHADGTNGSTVFTDDNS